MSSGFLNPSAGLGGTMPTDPIGEMTARQKLAKLLASERGGYADASPKQHPMQVLAQVVQGAAAGMEARQQFAASLAQSKVLGDLAGSYPGASMPAADAAAAQGTASARPAATPPPAVSIPGQLGALDDNNLDLAVRTAMAEAGGGLPSPRPVPQRRDNPVPDLRSA